MASEKGIIQQNIMNNETLLKIIIVSVFISFGTSLVVSSIVNLFGSGWSLSLLFSGLVIIFISSIVLLFKIFKKFSREIKIEGFLVYDKKKNKLVDVEDYNFSFEIKSFLESAFNEDKALKTIWEKLPLKKVFNHEYMDDKKKSKTEKRFSSKNLIEQAFEYEVLQSLSMTLTDFFDNENFKEGTLKKYKREDIPSVLLSNRFLNLFSKPMDERAAFIKDTFKEKETRGETVMCWKDGAFYSKFELVLPKKANIKRSDENKISIESDKIEIQINTIFNGCGAVLPHNFEKYYMGLEDRSMMRYPVYSAILKINIKFKLRSLLTSSGWKYYKWLDNLISSLNQEISKDYFFKLLNWEQTGTIIRILGRDSLQKRRKKG